MTTYQSNMYNTLMGECKKITANSHGGQSPHRITKAKSRKLSRIIKYFAKANR